MDYVISELDEDERECTWYLVDFARLGRAIYRCGKWWLRYNRKDQLGNALCGSETEKFKLKLSADDCDEHTYVSLKSSFMLDQLRIKVGFRVLVASANSGLKKKQVAQALKAIDNVKYICPEEEDEDDFEEDDFDSGMESSDHYDSGSDSDYQSRSLYQSDSGDQGSDSE
jgi:hypothetical protein